MKVKVLAYDPNWGIDEIFEADSEEKALESWIDCNRDYLVEKANELDCYIHQLGQTQRCIGGNFRGGGKKN